MNVPQTRNALAAPAARDQDAALRQVCRDLESVFVRQLLDVMRQAGDVTGDEEKSQGERMFTAMLDDRLAQVTAEKMHRGVGEALYRQLSQRLAEAARPAQEGNEP